MDNTVGQTQAIQTPAVAQTPNTVQVPNYSGVNIQIFNPSVAAPGACLPPSTINAQNYSSNPISYPANYYTQNLAQPTQVLPIQTVQPVAEATKKEKREIVQLTDDYIKNLETHLNDQNKDVRTLAAKEVVARFQEDKSRKNDAALNALVNKMLQDPYQPIRFMAMSVLESRAATGNDTTLQLVKNLQQKEYLTDYGREDALKATNVLLKMSGDTMTKEFEVNSTSKKDKGEKE